MASTAPGPGRELGRRPRWAARGLLWLPLVLPVAFSPFEQTAESAKAAVLYACIPSLLACRLGRPPWSMHRARHLPAPVLAALGLAAVVAACGAVATWAARDPLHSLVGTAYWRGGLLTTLCQLALFVMALATFGSRRRARDLLAAVTAGSIPVSAYAVVQAAGADVVAWDVEFAGRAFATLGSPTVLGSYLALALPISAAGALAERDVRGRRLASLAVALQAAALVATLSRGAWLAGIVGLAVVAAATPMGRARRLGVVAAVAVAALGLAAVLRPDPRTGMIRLALWREAAAVVAERPLVGHGQETFGLVFPARQSPELRALVGRDVVLDRAHNLWLDAAFDIGVPGAAALAALMAVVVRSGVRRAFAAPAGRARYTDAGLAGALVAYVVQGLFTFPTIVPAALFWLLAGAALASPRTRPREQMPPTGAGIDDRTPPGPGGTPTPGHPSVDALRPARSPQT